MIVHGETMTDQQIQDVERIAKEARNEYYKKYRATHKEEYRQYRLKYWNRRGRQLQKERREAAKRAEEEQGGV